MANQVRIRTSIEVVNDNSVSGEEGQDYTHKALDGNADSRMWGGRLNGLDYDSDAVAYYKNAIIAQAASTNYMNTNLWNKADEAPVGTKPVSIQAIAVEYVSTIGASNSVTVRLSAENFAILGLGEAIVIPCFYNEALADVSIWSAIYSAGVTEATVNVLLVGQNS